MVEWRPVPPSSSSDDAGYRAIESFRQKAPPPDAVPLAPQELRLLKLLTEQTQRFSKGTANPWELAVADPQKPPKLPEGVSPAQLAAWTAVARVLLNLDETITKE